MRFIKAKDFKLQTDGWFYVYYHDVEIVHMYKGIDGVWIMSRNDIPLRSRENESFYIGDPVPMPEDIYLNMDVKVTNIGPEKV